MKKNKYFLELKLKLFVNIYSAYYKHSTDIMSLRYTGKSKGNNKFSWFLYQETIPDSFDSFAF